MEEEKKFNGIIIPTPDKEGDRGTLEGEIMGIAIRELALGPESLKMNYVFEKAEIASKAGLFWLEGTDPNVKNPYSLKACYYNLIQEFSRIKLSQQCAIRAMPTHKWSERKVPYLDYDFIFWHKGEPVRIGQQHSFGLHAMRDITGNDIISLGQMVRSWEKGEYEIKQSRYIRELNKILDDVTDQGNWRALDKEKHRLRTVARDAKWNPGIGPLMKNYV